MKDERETLLLFVARPQKTLGYSMTSLAHTGILGLVVAGLGLAASKALGNGNNLFLECPCSVASDGTTLTVNAGVRGFRQTDSGELRFRVYARRDSQSEYDILATLPLSVSLAAGEKLATQDWSTAIDSSNLTGEAVLRLGLTEWNGDYWAYQDELRIESPVTLEGAFNVGDLDYLEDTDDDGVGDLNEGLMDTDPADPESTPGDSTVDFLALYTQGYADLFGGDAVTRINHLVVGANTMLRDSDVPIQFRVVGAAIVDVANEDEWYSRVEKDVWLAEGDRHGADLMALFTMHPPNVPGGYGCAPFYRERGHVDPEVQKACYVNVKGYRGSFVLMHELGHAMGLAHSVSQGEAGTWRWSRGHDVPDEFMTIMSYGRGGVRLDVFSSPDSGCTGASGRNYPCGVAGAQTEGADAVTTLGAVRFQVARTRSALEDADEDGFVDPVDSFPNDSGEWWDADDDGLGDNADTDDDNDGVLDGDDVFPFDGSETADTDGDGVGDNADVFPQDPDETSDSDADGVGDNTDVFPDDPRESADSDGDGVGDNADLWPENPAESTDTDGDGVGDNADPDADGDGALNELDAFPLDATRSDLASYLFTGESRWDQAGEVLSPGGDGDAASFLIGVPQHDAGASENAGAVYLVAVSDLATMDAADGFADRAIGLGHVVDGANSWKFVGEAARDRAGHSVASTGDMDGDGQTDLLIGAPYHGTRSGAVYFVSGVDFASADTADGMIDRTIHLGHAAAQSGSWKFVGEANNDEAGISVASVADTDDDGKAELLIGAWGHDPGERVRAGATYYLASSDFFSADLADGSQDGVIGLGHTADQAASWKVIGESAEDRTGSPVAAPGDIDGDGHMEIALNSQSRTGEQHGPAGAVYLVSTLDLPDADTADGQTDRVVDLGQVASWSKSWKLHNGTTWNWAARPVKIARDGVGSTTWLAMANDLISSTELPSADSADGEDDGVVDLDNLAGPPHSWKLDTDPVSLVGDTDGDGEANFLATGYDLEGTYRVGYLFSLPLLANADALLESGGRISGMGLGVTPGIQRIFGALHLGRTGASSAGDVDGDGVSDILFGDLESDTANHRGTVYLLAGADLEALDRIDGSFDQRLRLWNVAGDTDSDGVSNTFDRDDDGDRVPDAGDAFPLDPAEWADTDRDGVGDYADAFPYDYEEQFDTDGDGVGNFSDDDDDGDGVADDEDAYPLDTNNDGTNNRDDPDDDGDGVVDAADAFPLNASESADTDGDGTGDNADTDDDGDGVADAQDAFPLDPAESTDTDADGVGDNADAFPSDANEILDTDGDGIGDNADMDDDGDGVLDIDDSFPLDASASTDADSDGVPDSSDAFPNDADETLDTDGDGIGNNNDTDDDGDGVADDRDLFPLDAARSTLTSYRFVPEFPFDRAGENMATAGDLDGDGRPELLIGASQQDPSGAVYVISSADLVTADESDGLRDGEVELGRVAAQLHSWKLLAEPGFEAGTALAPLGDLDGDDDPEFAVGADAFEFGAVYIVESQDLLAVDALDGLADGVVALNSVHRGSGSWILGASPRTGFGTSVSAAQQDDADTLLLGEPRSANRAEPGSTHRLVGARLLAHDSADSRVDGRIYIGSTTGQPYFRGEAAWDRAGYSVAAGDFDGDGEADAIIGAPLQDAGGDSAGAVYLAGSRAITAGLNELGTIASREHSWKFVGATANGQIGRSLSLGDFDGDGQTDLVLGGLGELVVLSGTSDHLQRIDLDDGTLDGIIDLGRAGLQTGSRRLTAIGHIAPTVVGDVDGDGMADLLIGISQGTTSIGYLVLASSFFDGETVSLRTLATRPGVYTFHVLNRPFSVATTGAPGDVDGDGLDDLLLGLVPRYEIDDDSAGVYLVTAADLPHLDIDEDHPGGAIHLSSIVSSRP